ncbi:MAG: hypothetical protein AB1468_02320, partial [Candidatus Micrarchaeota archaeon]
VTPPSFSKLFKQRRRWYTGYLENALNYRALWSPRYGDFGLFVFPAGLSLLFAGLFVFLYSIYETISSIHPYTLLVAPRFDIFYLQPTSLAIFWVLVLAIVFTVFLLGTRQFGERGAFTLFVSYVSLSFILSFFWIYSMLERILFRLRGVRPTWRGK